MKASKNSLHSKLYQFFYNKKVLPNNLCPYFWKLVIATILILPLFIIQLPSRIENLIKKEYRHQWDHAGWGILLYLLLCSYLVFSYATFEWIKAMLHCYSYNSNAAMAGCILNLIVVTILLCIAGWQTGKRMGKRSAEIEREQSEKPPVEKKPSIIIEFIKAKYHKYCPTIEWE